MRVGLLGPLHVEAGGAVVLVSAAKERAVLELLALRNGAAMSTDELIFGLWGERPPKSARKAVQTYVASLRRLLPPGSVISTPSGYSLPVEEVDAAVFEDLVSRGRRLAAAGDEAAAIDALARALALWRGPPLADVADHQLGAGELTRLEELRRGAAEELVDLRLSAGEHEVLVPELEAAVAAEPLREHRWAQLMLALYRGGRQAEALRAYQRLRRQLGEELGLDPGEEVTALEDAILAQKPELRWTPRPDDRPRPPPRVPAPAMATRLPVAANSFVGRDQACAAIAELLDRARLVTVIGPAGCGKTRIAVEIANRLGGRFFDGVALVALADLDPGAPGEGVERRVALTLGVSEEPNQALLATVVAALAGRDMLLLLDNCEHVVADAARVGEALVSACAHLCLLATSREALRSPSEHRFVLPPLVARSAAELFADRARAVAPGTVVDADEDLVARVCQQLDGLPLALEIAAARLETRTLPELAADLSDRFEALQGGARTAESRHRTLRAAIDWSYQLLDDTEQSWLRKMGVFAAGATPIETRAVCGPADPSTLIQKSLLLRVAGPDGNRLEMHEMIRRYALDRLESSGEAAATRTHHGAAYTSLAETTAPLVRGPDQEAAIRRLDAERANLAAALAWARECRQWRTITAIGRALWWYWFRTDQAAFGLTWLRQGLERATDDDPEARAAAGYLGWAVDDFATATADAQQALAAPDAPSSVRALALGVLARIHGDHGDFQLARQSALASEQLYLSVGDAWTVAWARRCRASAALLGGDADQASTLTADALSRFREIGDDWAVAGCLDLLAGIAQRGGDGPAAFRLAQESVACHRRFHDISGTRWSLIHLAEAARQAGDLGAAERAATESLQLAVEHGYRMGALHAHLLLAEIGSDAPGRSDHARQAAELARQLDDHTGLAAANALLDAGTPGDGR